MDLKNGHHPNVRHHEENYYFCNKKFHRLIFLPFLWQRHHRNVTEQEGHVLHHSLGTNQGSTEAAVWSGLTPSTHWKWLYWLLLHARARGKAHGRAAPDSPQWPQNSISVRKSSGSAGCHVHSTSVKICSSYALFIVFWHPPVFHVPEPLKLPIWEHLCAVSVYG